MNTSIVNRLSIILAGYEFIPLSVSYHGGGDLHWHAVPVCVYLLDTDLGPIMVEAGLDERKLRDTKLRAKYFPQPAGFPTPLVGPQHEIIPQLVTMGYVPEQVEHLILTHLHADHTGHTLSFPKATVYVQEKEYKASVDKTPAEGYIKSDYCKVPYERLQFTHGDETLFPGVDLIFTPGHTDGHQSALVTLKDERKFLLVGDVVDDRTNMSNNILPGGMTDPAAARLSMERIRTIMDDGALGVFLHDAQQVRELSLSPQWL
jgi:N-acyl homoserine lactone hydrolase